MSVPADDPFAVAALNKIRMAEADLGDLEALREGSEDERPHIQRALEGILNGGASAGDQLAQALARRLGLRLGRNTPSELLRAVAARAPELGELERQVDAFSAWANEPIVRDARERRNLAVHAHYEKRPYREKLTWLLDAITIRGEPSVYNGPLDVHTYCATYVATLRRLCDVATTLGTKES